MENQQNRFTNLYETMLSPENIIQMFNRAHFLNIASVGKSENSS